METSKDSSFSLSRSLKSSLTGRESVKETLCQGVDIEGGDEGIGGVSLIFCRGLSDTLSCGGDKRSARSCGSSSVGQEASK